MNLMTLASFGGSVFGGYNQGKAEAAGHKAQAAMLDAQAEDQLERARQLQFQSQETLFQKGLEQVQFGMDSQNRARAYAQMDSENIWRQAGTGLTTGSFEAVNRSLFADFLSQDYQAGRASTLKQGQLTRQSDEYLRAKSSSEQAAKRYREAARKSRKAAKESQKRGVIGGTLNAVGSLFS